MKVLHVGQIELNKENKEWYNREGYHMTGDTLAVEWELDKRDVLSSVTQYVVFNGKWTRSGTVRDCGDHYIYAGYSSYYSIDKNTLAVTENVDDR